MISGKTGQIEGRCDEVERRVLPMVTSGADLTLALVDNVVNLGYEDIPEEVVEITKTSILDSLGVILAASTAGAGCKEVVEIAKEAGGTEESTILAFGGKVPCWMAGFANGAMIHALDYDDIYYPALLHPSNTTFASALAIAERKGKVSGRELIAALALANELVCRLGLSISTPPAVEHKKQNWQIRQTLGIFGATAAAGKVLGFTRKQMINALGIASQQASGTREVSVSAGSILRGLYAAPVGLWGPLASLMVEKGVGGPATWLEGPKGLYKVYFDGLYNRDSILTNLGKTFEVANTGYKPWPSCGATHSNIDATLRLVKENDLRPEEVAEVTVSVGDSTKELFEPLEMRRKPPTAMDAKRSLPFILAWAIVKRQVVLANFTSAGLRSPEILEVAEKVTPRYDPALVGTFGLFPALVSIRTKSGHVHECRVNHPYGHPVNPISKEDLISKFRDCASFSVKPLPAESIVKVIEMVARLEEIDDVCLITELVS